MKKLLLLSVATLLSIGGFVKAADASLLIRNSSKDTLSYEFVDGLKANSPTKKASGEIAPGETLSFKPHSKTVEFQTKQGKTVTATVKSTGYVIVEKINKNDIKFGKGSDALNDVSIS